MIKVKNVLPILAVAFSVVAAFAFSPKNGNEKMEDTQTLVWFKVSPPNCNPSTFPAATLVGSFTLEGAITATGCDNSSEICCAVGYPSNCIEPAPGGGYRLTLSCSTPPVVLNETLQK